MGSYVCLLQTTNHFLRVDRTTKNHLQSPIKHCAIMKTLLLLVSCLLVVANAAPANKDDDKYCDTLAKKCKAGDQDACELYKKKCGKDEDKYCNALAKKCKAGNKDVLSFTRKTVERTT